MDGQIEETGAQTMLHGIGPTWWPDRQSVVPTSIPVGSVLIASETDLSFKNLEWISIFREWTPAQLWEMTNGPRRDPGWDMDIVNDRLIYTIDQTMKQPTATAYQYMPERIAELMKQDGTGYWGSDAVPTIDIWDTYFKETGKGKDGIYRRIVLDWGLNASTFKAHYDGKTQPKSPNRKPGKDQDGFIYSSGSRKYADSWDQICHFQFGDTSAYAPFKYHSVRSLGWLLWGPCELDNRLYCKTMEQAFLQLMWFFRVPGQNDFNRLKLAQFQHFGVLPNGVSMIPGNERYNPDPKFIELAMGKNQQLKQEAAASYMQSFENEGAKKDETAAATMARVNAVNEMVSGMLEKAYRKQGSQYREICRRLCIPNSKDAIAREFRRLCLRDGVPAEMLNVDNWEIEVERAIGGGNQTMQMAQIQFLNTIRKNMGPQGQRIIDHMSVFAGTQQADLAEEIAPMRGMTAPSNSMESAQKLTPRLMEGLPVPVSPDMIYEDYVLAWLGDMTTIVQQVQQKGLPTPDEMRGLQNMAMHVGNLLKIMSSDDEAKPKIKQYGHLLGQLVNHLKGFQQRLQQATAKQNGQPGVDPKEMAKLQGQQMIYAAKAQNLVQSHATRTAQRQIQFESEEARKDRAAKAELRRKAAETGLELAHQTMSSAQELQHNRMKSLQEPKSDE